MQNCPIHMRGLWSGKTSRCEWRTQCDVHRQLRPLVDWQSRGQDFNGPFIIRAYLDVDVSELGVHSDRGSGFFTAHSGQCPFRWHCSCARPARAWTGRDGCRWALAQAQFSPCRPVDEPWWSNEVAACCNSPKHPSASGSPNKAATNCSTNCGRRHVECFGPSPRCLRHHAQTSQPHWQRSDLTCTDLLITAPSEPSQLPLHGLRHATVVTNCVSACLGGWHCA